MALFFYCQENLYAYFEDYLNSLRIHIPQKTGVRLYTKPISPDVFSSRTNGISDRHIFLQKVPREAYQNLNKNSIYLLSTEQLSRRGCFDYVCKRNDDTVIDYSEENINYYADRKKVYHIPYQINRHEIYDYAKENEVAMIGNNAPRRWQIYNELSEKNIKVDNIRGWRRDRDERLFTYKILVNVHFRGTDCKITEQMRINRCVFNRMIVVTEESLYQDDLALKPYMLFSPFDQISGLVEDVIHNYAAYYTRLFDGFDLEKIHRNLVAKLHDFLATESITAASHTPRQ